MKHRPLIFAISCLLAACDASRSSTFEEAAEGADARSEGAASSVGGVGFDGGADVGSLDMCASQTLGPKTITTQCAPEGTVGPLATVGGAIASGRYILVSDVFYRNCPAAPGAVAAAYEFDARTTVFRVVGTGWGRVSYRGGVYTTSGSGESSSLDLEYRCLDGQPTRPGLIPHDLAEYDVGPDTLTLYFEVTAYLPGWGGGAGRVEVYTRQ
jgi:hypothetical protein